MTPVRCLLKDFYRDTTGYAGAEVALLALLLCGACFLVSGKLTSGARHVASALMNVLAGTP